jgi:diguanylate cyclase
VSDLVELQLKTSTNQPTDSAWKALILNVLRLMCEVEPESASQDSAELRGRLNEHRAALGRPMHPQEERQTAAECVKTCDKYLRRIQQDHTARVTELVEMVAILREAATRFVGDSSDFNARVQLSTDRLKMMNRLEDIRDLKQQLSLEVTSLERAVEDKKKRDEEQLATLSQKVKVLQDDLVKAEEQATIDSLTKIPNRGAFDRALVVAMKASRKDGKPLTLAMVDIDHFKQVNDSHGHLIGDRVLLCTAQWLQGSIRSTDFVARYGGEEFACILTGMNLAQTDSRFTQVLKDIAARSYEYEMNGEHKSVRFTVSCGIAELVPSDGGSDLVGRADQALYEAKHKGRNRVVAKKVSRLSRLLSRA